MVNNGTKRQARIKEPRPLPRPDIREVGSKVRGAKDRQIAADEREYA